MHGNVDSETNIYASALFLLFSSFLLFSVVLSFFKGFKNHSWLRARSGTKTYHLEYYILYTKSQIWIVKNYFDYIIQN